MTDRPTPVARWQHTAILIAIFLGLAALGARAQHNASANGGLVAQHPNVIPLYLSLILAEWLLVFYVVRGIRSTGTTLRDLMGGALTSRRNALIDVGLFAEEIVFRGYLQRQFRAWTGNAGVAIVAQALVFGIGHGYQGVDACVRITVYGLLFGLLAQWRKSLRPGMIAHAFTDIVAGIV